MAREIQLTRGYVTVVDDEDFDWLSAWRWQARIDRSGAVYASRAAGPRGLPHVFMHREILACPKGLLVDHRDRNSLDNRRSNLRLATFSQNITNRSLKVGRSGFRGVNIKGDKFIAKIRLNRKDFHLGTFSTADEASRAYDKAAVRLHGEFAQLNWPSLPADQREDA